MSLEPGQSLSHYRLVAKIGEGGMGVVWRAEDRKLGRPVALKVLPESFSSDPGRLSRLQGEARAIAALNHPNIVTLYSVEEAGGIHFLTMELVEGRALDTLIPPDGFRLRDFFRIAIPMADAVRAAHEKGVSHRDLKPSNVMLGPEARVKVLDFGLAKLRPPGGTIPSSLAPTQAVTEEGVVLGTAAYMSPEQLRGEPADQRSDLFSLGIILYEMASGRRPFSGASFAEHASSILRDIPPELHEVDRSMPRHLGRIVRRCLEKDPGRRFQTALDLRVELEDLRDELETSARDRERERSAAPSGEVPVAAGAASETPGKAAPPAPTPDPPVVQTGSPPGFAATTAEDPPPPPRAPVPPTGRQPAADARRAPRAAAPAGRTPPGTPEVSPPAAGMDVVRGAGAASKGGEELAWGLVAIAAVVVAVVVLSVLRRGSPEPPSEPLAPPVASPAASTPVRPRIVVLPFENLGSPEDAYFAAGMTEEITSRLAAVRGLAVISRTTAVGYDAAGKTLRQVGADLGVDYVLEGTVRWDRPGEGPGRVRVTPQLIRVADDTHVWADRYHENLEDVFAVQARVAQRVLGELNVELLEPERAVLEARPTENLDAYEAYLRGKDLESVGTYDEETHLRQIAMYERAVELDPAFTVAWAALGRAHAYLNILGLDRTPERVAHAREAVDRALALDPDLPETQLALGYFYYHALRDYDSAMEAFERARERLPNDADLLSAIGFIRRRQGRWEESLENLRRAFELDPHSSSLAREIGNDLSNMRRYPEAIEFYDRSIALRPDQTAAYLIKAGTYVAGWGDLEAARDTLRAMPRSTEGFATLVRFLLETDSRNFQAALDLLDAWPHDLFEMPSQLLPKQTLRAATLRALGREADARAALLDADGLLRREVDARPDDHRAYSALGIVHAMQGRAEEAIREGRRGVDLYPISRDALHGPQRVRDLAHIYAILGRSDEAVEQLRSLLAIPCFVTVPALRIEPRWDPIRETPAFQALLESAPPEGGGG